MKRFMLVFLVVLLSVSLTGCSEYYTVLKEMKSDYKKELSSMMGQYEKIDSLESNESSLTNKNEESVTTDDEFLTWDFLSIETERYELVITLLGKNLITRTYAEETYSELSREEKRLVKKLFEYVNKHNDLPEDFTETLEFFCMCEEYEDRKNQRKEFYQALLISFDVSWGSEGFCYISIKEEEEKTTKINNNFVEEENPFVYTFDEKEHDVGNCLIVLKKVEIVNTPHKSYVGMSTYAKHIRIQTVVKNKSSKDTYLNCKKSGSFLIGKYYGTNNETNISWNDNYKWKVDSDIESKCVWNIKANETKDICVTGVFIDSDRLKYSDDPDIDLYFENEGNDLTISIN